MRTLFPLVAFLAVALWTSGASSQTFQDFANAGHYGQAITAFQAQLKESPDNADARLALATAQLFAGVERLGQALYRHGLEAPRRMDMPFLRIPVPFNPWPQPLNYEGMRTILQAFLSDLAGVQATLAAMPPEATPHLRLNLATARIDLNADGQVTEEESLAAVLEGLIRQGFVDLSPQPAPQAAPPSFVVVFDRADAYWLQGYCHVTMGMGEVLLAYNWQETFDRSFHLFFPRAGLPGKALPHSTDWGPDIADIIALIHSVRWPLVEPHRVAAAHAHFLEVPRLSHLSWASILAETDDEREWIPGPQQKNGAISGLPITAEMLESWGQVMNLAEAVLRGERLIPHWRFAQSTQEDQAPVKGINLAGLFAQPPQGLNLAHMFAQPPQTLDLVYLIQGSDALPYVETGSIISRSQWQEVTSAFGGMFPMFAFWVN